MKDINGIEMTCENCAPIVACICPNRDSYPCKTDTFLPSPKAYETRIEELQNSLDETEKKLTETIKLLGERSRECGELEALLEIKNKSNMSTQSTDAADVSKKIREMDMRNVWWR